LVYILETVEGNAGVESIDLSLPSNPRYIFYSNAVGITPPAILRMRIIIRYSSKTKLYN